MLTGLQILSSEFYGFKIVVFLTLPYEAYYIYILGVVLAFQ
jgi:hypothetical protein